MIKYGLGLGEATVDAYKILPDSLPEELRKIYYGLKNTVNSKVILVKVINPYKIPTYFTAVLSDGNKTLPIYGSGSSIDEDYAIMRSLTEAYQLVSVENENESQQLEKRLHKMWSDIPSVQRMLSLSFTEKLPSIRYCRCNLHMKKVSEMIDFETTELRRTGRKLYYRVVKESQGFVLIQSLIPHFERFNLILEGQIVVPRIKA
jgi:ribosomal protein S12 methylthiotransferase accessory factor